MLRGFLTLFLTVGIFLLHLRSGYWWHFNGILSCEPQTSLVLGIFGSGSDCLGVSWKNDEDGFSGGPKSRMSRSKEQAFAPSSEEGYCVS